jgi:hypothetical protein
MDQDHCHETDWSLLDTDEVAEEIFQLEHAHLRQRRVRFTQPFFSRGRVSVDGETIRMTLEDVPDAPRDDRENDAPVGMVSGTVPRQPRRTPSQYAFVAEGGRRGRR